MKNMSISEFKAHALATLDRVARSKEGLVITRRGRPLVHVIPFRGSRADGAPGKLAHTLVFEKDIVSPLGTDAWEACR
ncbi:MAG TPA: type II toxin-antitoxin system Phd/YefM family antitoxin [Planctomycetota bacterium]|nr:type II toxin-antitoxin system Phd/YefM family antitoxin [Planctomycetota bacterium]